MVRQTHLRKFLMLMKIDVSDAMVDTVVVAVGDSADALMEDAVAASACTGDTAVVAVDPSIAALPRLSDLSSAACLAVRLVPTAPTAMALTPMVPSTHRHLPSTPFSARVFLHISSALVEVVAVTTVTLVVLTHHLPLPQVVRVRVPLTSAA